ncbi:monovalent cation/H+ antiporter complex subunit F [Roseomonas elaeocarpi]|uniref:Monovalent cation/H+ antiporter complex subunit F n=1 Tax=Roseomonas elaeocarpi TaxID=907779 RepID=A0ABV6JWN5_9PROT
MNLPAGADLGAGWPWMLALLALLPAFALSAAMALRGSVGARLVAAQLASSVAVLALVTMSFAFDQSSLLDLPLTLVLLSLPGTLVMALFLERWL